MSSNSRSGGSRAAKGSRSNTGRDYSRGGGGGRDDYSGRDDDYVPGGNGGGYSGGSASRSASKGGRKPDYDDEPNQKFSSSARRNNNNSPRGPNDSAADDFYQPQRSRSNNDYSNNSYPNNYNDIPMDQRFNNVDLKEDLDAKSVSSGGYYGYPGDIPVSSPSKFERYIFPQIRVNSINLSSLNSSAFTFSTPNDNKNLNEMTIGMGLAMSVSTYNPNMYDLQVDEINLVAYMMVNTTYVDNELLVMPLTSLSSLVSVVSASGSPPLASSKPSGYTPSTTPKIGTANQSSILFPSKTWVNYTMMFELSYTPDPYVGLLSDPAVEEIADACGITSRYTPKGRPMKIYYEATSTISILKPLGYSPTISNDISIVCPISQSQIDAVVAAVEGGTDAIEALTSIL
ncbi:hypothetical protein HDU83_009541 [Entophlyctis luteolus]|nr:hypothetical protein HDU83_009541 [Entophlyctis luteolus]